MVSTPDYLFRVFSSSSNGINTAQVFKPASVMASPKALRKSIHAGFRAEELRIALRGSKVSANPFIFFTPSLLHALQFAAQQKSKGATGIRIACLRISTARTSDGNIVEFHSVPQLIEKYGTQTRSDKDGKPCSYEGEWVAIDCSVVPGKGSSIVALDSLLQLGLYRLYPELGQVAEKRNGVHIYSALRSLRQYCFLSGRTWNLTAEALSVATRLAAAFYPIQAGSGKGSNVTFAWLLALRKWEVDGDVLKAWLSRRTSSAHIVRPAAIDLTVAPDVADSQKRLPLLAASSQASPLAQVVIDLTGDEGQDETITGEADSGCLPEMNQYATLRGMFGDKHLRPLDSDATAMISLATIAEAARDWKTWIHQSGKSGRVEHPLREQSSRVERSFRVEKPIHYRRRSRPWVPREEYRREKARRSEFRRGR